MSDQVALIGIIVSDRDSAEALNALLHDHADHIVGRMGIPYRERKINIISIAMDAPEAVVSALTERIGKLAGVSVKTVYAGS